MSRFRAVTVCALLVCGACAKSHDPAADEAAIRSLDADWVKAAAAKDAARFASYYADNGSVLPPGAPMATGHDAILKTAEGLMALPGFALTFAPTVVEVSGDAATEVGDYALTANDKDGKPQTSKGKYVVVWRRQTDGNWKVRIDAPTTTQ